MTVVTVDSHIAPWGRLATTVRRNSLGHKAPGNAKGDLVTVLTIERDERAAVDKAVSLLSCFGEDASTGVGVSELARRAELSKSTAYRVLTMLERNGLVERIGSNYRLGDQLHRLGRSVYPAALDHVRDLLIPFLAALYERTHQTVHLAALHGTDVVYLGKLYGPRAVRSPSRIGGRVPAYCTAVGKAMLAHNASAAALTLAAPLRPWTARTVTDADALAAQLNDIRRYGLAQDDEEAQLGLRCIAVPVLARDGRPVAGLSVSVPVGATDPQRYGPDLRRVGAEASRAVSAARIPLSMTVPMPA
jgi:IclR family KDG regulon transcriptional repressor